MTDQDQNPPGGSLVNNETSDTQTNLPERIVAPRLRSADPWPFSGLFRITTRPVRSKSLRGFAGLFVEDALASSMCFEAVPPEANG